LPDPRFPHRHGFIFYFLVFIPSFSCSSCFTRNLTHGISISCDFTFPPFFHPQHKIAQHCRRRASNFEILGVWSVSRLLLARQICYHFFSRQPLCSMIRPSAPGAFVSICFSDYHVGALNPVSTHSITVAMGGSRILARAGDQKSEEGEALLFDIRKHNERQVWCLSSSFSRPLAIRRMESWLRRFASWPALPHSCRATPATVLYYIFDFDIRIFSPSYTSAKESDGHDCDLRRTNSRGPTSTKEITICYSNLVEHT
jgi:hypothetical protein